jgi:hypothetical protein
VKWRSYLYVEWGVGKSTGAEQIICGHMTRVKRGLAEGPGSTWNSKKTESPAEIPPGFCEFDAGSQSEEIGSLLACILTFVRVKEFGDGVFELH